MEGSSCRELILDEAKKKKTSHSCYYLSSSTRVNRLRRLRTLDWLYRVSSKTLLDVCQLSSIPISFFLSFFSLSFSTLIEKVWRSLPSTMSSPKSLKGSSSNWFVCLLILFASLAEIILLFFLPFCLGFAANVSSSSRQILQHLTRQHLSLQSSASSWIVDEVWSAKTLQCKR